MAPRAGIAAVLAGCAIAVAPAQADTFKPTRFDDPPPGVCKENDCSLREAVRAADKEPSHSKILLGKGIYKLEIPPGSPETDTGDLDMFRPATLVGKGVRKTQISGELIDRVFDLNPSAGIELPEHTFRDLTIRNGLPGPFEEGGAIRAFISKLKLDGVAVRHSFAPGGGGGIFAFRAEIAILRSTILNTEAPVGGGVLIPNGAAIPNTLTVRASTISENQAEVGGGLALEGAFHPPSFDQPPEARIITSTIADNEAFVSGGGVSATQGGEVTLDHATIAHNAADLDDSGGGDGGGIYQSTSADFQLADSVVGANAVGSSGAGAQCAGEFTSTGSGNVFQTQTGSGVCTFISGTITAGGDLLLGVLADNGGPTRTVALLSGSPALGNAEACPRQDQRGRERPDDDCDSGAFERRGP